MFLFFYGIMARNNTTYQNGKQKNYRSFTIFSTK